jgi:hypothetical protein
MFIKIQTGGGTATFYKSVKRSNAIARKAKNGSSNHGEPFFFGEPLLTSPKGREKRKPLPTSPKERSRRPPNPHKGRE